MGILHIIGYIMGGCILEMEADIIVIMENISLLFMVNIEDITLME